MKMNVKWVWIRDAKGQADTMLTFSVVAFALVCFKVLLGGLTIKGYLIAPIDPATIAALLTPTLTAYVARKYTDKKFVDKDDDGIDDDEEAAAKAAAK